MHNRQLQARKAIALKRATDQCTKQTHCDYTQVHRTAKNKHTAGLVFGGTDLRSYCVSGVDGSCAEHSTVESYTVIICLQS